MPGQSYVLLNESDYLLRSGEICGLRSTQGTRHLEESEKSDFQVFIVLFQG